MKNNKGFTLVELVVVIVVLAILIGVTVSGIFHFVEKSHETADVDNASSLYTVLSQLENDDDFCNWSINTDKKEGKTVVVAKWDSAKRDASNAEWVDSDPVIKGTGVDQVTLSMMLNDYLENGLPAPSSGGHFRVDFKTNKSKPYIIVSAYSSESESEDTLLAKFGNDTEMGAVTAKDLYTDEDDEEGTEKNDEPVALGSKKYKLTVHFVDEDDNKLADDYVGMYAAKATYEVEGKSISGYTSIIKKLCDNMPSHDIEKTITYIKNKGLATGYYYGIPWYVDEDYTLHLAYKTDIVLSDERNIYWQDYIGSIKKVIVENNIKSDKMGIASAEAYQAMFRNHSNLEEVVNSDKFHFEKIRSIYCMFAYCPKLTTLDTSSWNLSDVVNMSCLFYSTNNLKVIDTHNWNPKNCENFSGMFDAGVTRSREVTNLDVSGWVTSKTTNIQCMFRGCDKVKTLDVSDWDTSNVLYMKSLFNTCSAVEELDVSNWDTHNVITFAWMFSGCTSITELDVSNFTSDSIADFVFDTADYGRTSNALTMMFHRCNKVKTLDLRKFGSGLGNIKIFTAMFDDCNSLEEIKGLSNFNTHSCECISDMFIYTALSTIDISGWDITSMKSNNLSTRNQDLSPFGEWRGQDFVDMRNNVTIKFPNNEDFLYKP